MAIVSNVVRVAGSAGCNCSSLGSESNVCDIRSGQCRCKPHVTGRACDTCEEGYWGLTAGGCRRCECGAGAAACDPVTGACACARGVTGAHCNTCLSGFYGFGPAGCLPCPTCTEGKVCSRDSGRCVCPSATRGPRCGACARGHWGRAPNCSRCECGPGATGPNCDPITGQCQCRLGWAGRRCERCAGGHYGPRCRPCACDPAGAVSSQCDDDGRCVCKENVIGDKCSRCKEGTFGLSPTTPGGCTACFCFGRSAHCTQAGLTRAAVHAARHTHVTVVPGPSYKHLEQESLLAIHSSSPEVTIALPRPPVPVYVELDKRFLGDRVTSYGGLLRFTVEEEGGEELPAELLARFPLVRLAGPPPLALDYYQRTPSRNGTHSVRLHESLWQVTSPAPPAPHGAPAPRAAARAALMVALQQVTRLLLRVTTRQPVTDYVHALLLNVSLDTAIDGVSRSAPAEGVELCECPEQYAASSCHHPAVGFWMPPQSVHYKSVAGTIVIELEGDARACECGGRASECDPRTGDCLNCTANTAGPRCDICAPGHHGSPAAGCLPCPCPHDTRNHAAACAVEPTLQCLCLPGYTGEKCDACTPDYKPTLTGDCEPCDCDPYGSLSQHCDESGKCLCQDFATGDKCDKCRDRSAFMDNGGCSPCDNCSQTLLHTISHINSELKSKADPTELRRLPKPYPALLQFSSNCSHLYNQLPLLREYREGSRRLGEELEEVWGRGEEVKGRVEAQRELALINDKAANYLSLESMTEDVLTLRRRIAEQVSLLDDFAQGERHVSAHRALRHAAHLLAVIKGVSLETRAAAARDVLDKVSFRQRQKPDGKKTEGYGQFVSYSIMKRYGNGYC
ncbi:hypothetical protein JYU34_002958 [Plutella xylostella]|uniref:Uncharacterized protein n=1 Tax=Plutella xylostella TaxID=51655 RepID=A0ABQ7R3J7_PLUXY|nr:hypothetical protein JYU34_002958 [Plutella xylostella]